MPAKKTKEQVIEQISARNLNFPPVFPADPEFIFEGNLQRIEWKCENNHIFPAVIKNVLKGCGCRKCSTKNNIVVDTFLTRLEERNKNHPDKIVKIKDINEYDGMTKKMTWICMENHEWQASPKTIVKGCYCGICSNAMNGINQRFNTEELFKKITDHNNDHPHKWVKLEDISNYKTNKSVLGWSCEKGHTWSTPLGFIIDSHCGCPVCAKSGYSVKAINYLEYIAKKENIHIQHATNGGEYKIPNSNYYADGYCAETNTIYEFHGDVYHGNPELFDSNEKSSFSHKTNGELYDNTIKRENFIKEQGFNLVVKWENDYDNKVKHKKDLNNIIKFLSKYECNVSTSTEFDIFLKDFNIAINYISLKLHTHAILKDKNYHNKCYNLAAQQGIRLITIFSNEWLHSKAKVKDSLRYFIGHAERGIAARKTVIRKIPWVESKEFLNKYHLLNSGSAASISLGAFDKNKLIAVMTFGRPVGEHGQLGYYEMTRFVTDKKTHPGLGSKMFKYAVKKYNFEKIIAFVDKRWFTGEFKTITGFKKISESNPTIWYTNGTELYNRRFKTRKKLLKELNMPDNTTKDSMLLSLGYKTIYDCGKLKLEWLSNK